MILIGEALVEKSAQLAETHHVGQYRADDITPYTNHTTDVAKRFIEAHCWTYSKQSTLPDGIRVTQTEDFYRGVAICNCHDLVEDVCHVTFDYLSEEGLESIIPELKLLTKLQDDSYLNYLLRLKASRNQLALQVKLCDMDANESDLHNIPDVHRRRVLKTKYEMARHILTHS